MTRQEWIEWMEHDDGESTPLVPDYIEDELAFELYDAFFNEEPDGVLLKIVKRWLETNTDYIEETMQRNPVPPHFHDPWAGREREPEYDAQHEVPKAVAWMGVV